MLTIMIQNANNIIQLFSINYLSPQKKKKKKSNNFHFHLFDKIY